MLSLAPPHTIVEVEPGEGAIRAWEPIYNFDTTDKGRFEPLPIFHFELKEEAPKHAPKYPRPFRLYQDGEPCLGCQWNSSIEQAYKAVDYVVASYAHHRRSTIYAGERAYQLELERIVTDAMSQP